MILMLYCSMNVEEQNLKHAKMLEGATTQREARVMILTHSVPKNVMPYLDSLLSPLLRAVMSRSLHLS